MNNVSEWAAALLILAIVLVVFMFGGVLLTGIAIVLFCGLVVAATVDILNAGWGWLSSLFPSTKEKGKGEEESGGSTKD